MTPSVQLYRSSYRDIEPARFQWERLGTSAARTRSAAPPAPTFPPQLTSKDPSLLRGAIDTHVHSAPDVIPRRLNDLELVEQARLAGMRAVVLKSHACSTCARAYLLNHMQGDVEVLGGLVLNDTIGGFNCRAVETSLKMGGSIIWMPTKSAANHQHFFGGRNGLTVLDGPGLSRAARDVVRLVADAGAVLATGHLSPIESGVLIEEALAAGVRAISVTHPEWGATAMPVEMQQRFAGSGRVFFERCLVSVSPGAQQSVAFETIVRQIRAVGVESTIAATDYGLPDTLTPSEALDAYVRKLQDAGFTEIEIRRMIRDNPARLLQLS